MADGLLRPEKGRLEKRLIYFLTFLLGALAWRLRVFDTPPPRRKALYYAAAFTVWIPINVYAIVLLNLLIRPGEFFISETVDVLVLWIASQTSLAVLLYLVVSTFRFWFNREGDLGSAVNGASYGVYVIHLIVLGAAALALLHASLPSLVKYLIVVCVTWVVSNVVVVAYRRMFARSRPPAPGLEPVPS